MYDIYLSMGCRELPVLEDLVTQIPMLADPALQQKILTGSPHHPGFLGLDLPEELAQALFRRLKSKRAAGLWLLSAYRLPRVSKEQAAMLAEPAIAELKRKHFERYPDDTLSAVYFVGERPEVWVFGYTSEQLVAKNIIPGGPRVGVDKVDGHIWTREDFGRREQRLEGK